MQMYVCNLSNYLTRQECKFSNNKQKLAILCPYIVSLAFFYLSRGSIKKVHKEKGDGQNGEGGMVNTAVF